MRTSEESGLHFRMIMYMGYGYLRRGDYVKAYDTYEAAVGKYNLGTMNEDGIGQRNMGISRGTHTCWLCNTSPSLKC